MYFQVSDDRAIGLGGEAEVAVAEKRVLVKEDSHISQLPLPPYRLVIQRQQKGNAEYSIDTITVMSYKALNMGPYHED
jgi:hypothetical protein